MGVNVKIWILLCKKKFTLPLDFSCHHHGRSSHSSWHDEKYRGRNLGNTKLIVDAMEGFVTEMYPFLMRFCFYLKENERKHGVDILGTEFWRWGNFESSGAKVLITKSQVLTGGSCILSIFLLLWFILVWLAKLFY